MKHNQLTKQVLDLYSKNNELLSKQINAASLTEEADEVGYFVHFAFDDKTSIKPITDKKLPEVYGVGKDGKPLVGFVLFVTDGFIEMLEAYTYGNEDWPENDETITLQVSD